MNEHSPHTTVIVGSPGPQKSMGTALLLASLFGPFGLLYASVTGGIIMLVINLIVAILTLGIGLVFLWPVHLIWAAVAINKERERHALPLSPQNQPVQDKDAQASKPLSSDVEQRSDA